MAKIVILGLDGFNPELAKQWSGELPNLMKLQSEGIWGTVESTVPPTTATAWACAQTGANPGVLGFWDSNYRDDFSYGFPKAVDSTSITPAPLHRYLSHNRAKKVAIINVPFSWPPPEIPGGYAITDFTPPNLEQAFTWPASLKQEVQELIGEYLLDASTPEGIRKMDQQRFTLLAHFIRNKQCDYIFCVIMGINRLCHLGIKSQDILKEHYKFIDDQIGQLRALRDSETAFLIQSVYAMQPLDGSINLNEWLIKEGYLNLHRYPTALTGLNGLDVDWGKTKARSSGITGQIYLNIKGREPEGIVEPSECDGLIDDLGSKLKSITDSNGKRLDTNIVVYKNIQKGPLAQYGPDLSVIFDEYRWNTSEYVGREDRAIRSAGTDDAGHGSHGYFCLSGASIPNEGCKLGITVLDLAPTVLSIMGERMPAHLEGKPIATFKSGPTEETKVRNRLAALGY